MTSSLKTKAFTLLKVSSLSLLIGSSLLVSSNPAHAGVERAARSFLGWAVPKVAPRIIPNNNRRERNQSSAMPTHKLQYENAKIF